MRNLALVLLFAACTQQERPAAEQQAAPSPAASVESSAAAVQEHTIDVAAQFTPASVTLKAGEPARLHFRRGDAATCADEIVFPELNIRRKLPANQTVTVDLPAQQARTLRFACGMDMMKGTAVVQ